VTCRDTVAAVNQRAVVVVRGVVWCGGGQAEASFGQLLRINPQSVVVLRSYAQFLLEVVNHDAKAWMLLDEADRIEDATSRKLSTMHAEIVFDQENDQLDGSAETVGLISVSARPETLGQVRVGVHVHG
jgi:hypothetical protein